MREQYLRAVRRLLPRKVRQAVVRDLEERFDAAADHGESEADVIDRLGPAAAYADTVSAPLGGKRRAGFALPAAVLALAVALIAVFLAAQAGRPPENVIGQADAMTQIRVTGGADLAPVFLAAGLLAAAAAAVLFVLRIRRRKGERE